VSVAVSVTTFGELCFLVTVAFALWFFAQTRIYAHMYAHIYAHRHAYIIVAALSELALRPLCLSQAGCGADPHCVVFHQGVV